jgi:hypothetical protein
MKTKRQKKDNTLKKKITKNKNKVLWNGFFNAR